MNDFTDIVSKAMEVRPDEGDYTGKDGLLYCGKCHTPKEAYFEDGHAALFGRDRHPTNCACQQKRMDEKRLADQQRKHEDTVKELKKDCFDTPKLRDWCFAQDNGANPQMKHARFYADNFDTMLLDNIGYLLWGSVGMTPSVTTLHPQAVNPAVSAASSMSDEILVSLPMTTVGFLPVPSCREMAAACPMR